MIDFRLTQVADPTAAQLASFKEFAAVNSGSDALLLSMLKRAMVEVQAWDDRSLLVSTAVLTWADREDPGAPVRLYQSPATISSVVDGNGDSVSYSLVGNMLVPSYRVGALTITYTTSVSDADLAALLPKAFRYAAALYDGEDSASLARILQER